ncbi:Succinate dehydrogenase assembly factor 2 mitochondrial [Linderina macrospora]|uniref:Succinate dehydrogenase assembly factor 2 mitochondrial n=1 Tax=Linderina macrospora TaxID=4868 RepID=A0ACC1J5T5_9FUNG|nr:Succinate dehydrogenase assembly factor 2 mitochondrial [Linderina macrospora]
MHSAFLRTLAIRSLAPPRPTAYRILPVFQRTIATTRTVREEEPRIGLERKLREDESVEIVRRRLQYQMRKRGILETDLLLSTFAAEHLKSLTREELTDLDSLLSNIDWDIFYWATDKTPAPEQVASMGVFQKLRAHATKRGSKIVRMPDLEETK